MDIGLWGDDGVPSEYLNAVLEHLHRAGHDAALSTSLDGLTSLGRSASERDPRSTLVLAAVGTVDPEREQREPLGYQNRDKVDSLLGAAEFTDQRVLVGVIDPDRDGVEFYARHPDGSEAFYAIGFLKSPEDFAVHVLTDVLELLSGARRQELLTGAAAPQPGPDELLLAVEILTTTWNQLTTKHAMDPRFAATATSLLHMISETAKAPEPPTSVIASAARWIGARLALAADEAAKSVGKAAGPTVFVSVTDALSTVERIALALGQ